MFHSSATISKNATSSSETTAILTEGTRSNLSDDLRERIAVRFLIKKSKRFNFWKQQLEHKLQHKLQQTKITVKNEPSQECLLYLGLAPKNAKILDRKEPKQVNETNSQFRKPEIYECTYCMKFFFHKTPHRRHMIHHMKKVHWCSWCNRKFTTRISKRRHEIYCRR